MKTSRGSAIPTRNKHAHGVAERSVGNIVTKANIAMMGNINLSSNILARRNLICMSL